MKTLKLLSLFLALLMLLSVFVACDNAPDETTEQPKESQPTDENDRLNEQDNVPTDLKYNGETINFLVRDGSNMNKYELACEELINDPLYDAIHYRNIDVETRLDVKIKSIARTTYFPNTGWNNVLSVSVLTNTGDYDGAAFYLSSGASLAKEGIYYNLMKLTQDEDGYFDFDKPWWNQAMVEELSYCDAFFFAGGSLTISQAAGGVCVFFNRDLFNEKYPDDKDATLYQLVRDGKWTADRMAYYVSNCWDDMNSNGIIDPGDVVGIKSLGPGAGQMDAWVLAMGLDFTKTNMLYGEPEIMLFGNRTVPAYEKVRSVFNNAGGYIPNGEANQEETSLENGKLLFFTQCLDYGSNMKSSTVNYGVLPLPKYDEEQADYRTCFVNSSSALAVCSNLTPERAAMVSAAIELLSAESYKQVLPVYYETILKGHYSRDAADAEMYDRILGSFVFSFGFAWSTSSLGSISAVFRRLDSEYDIQNFIDSNKGSWEGQLAGLLMALEDVS